ncbi:MAG: hypothetical protein GF307_14630 [candidate division Zixibacteria bacterium]|nr:hypothetical protein [candidate division Zixibacteria bacterium]
MSFDPGVWLAAILTLCIFSFLYKDNPFYKFAEHLSVGVSAGYYLVVLIRQTLIPAFVNPLMAGYWHVVPELPRSFGIFLLIFPVFMGILLFARFSRKWAYVARYPIAMIWGIGSGVVIPLVLQNHVIRQLQATMVPITVQSWADIGNLFIAVGVLTGLVYFFFSKEHKGLFGGTAKVGIWILMIGFGSTFGFTVMARVSLLIGRIIFLMKDWLGIIG